MDMQALIKDLHDEEKNHMLEILSESEEDIHTYDYGEDKYINYHLTPPSDTWLKSSLVWGPSCKHLQTRYENNIISLLLSIDPNMLITLNHILFVANDADIDYVCEYIQEDKYMWPDQLDFSDEEIIEDNPVGVFWNYTNCIILNIHGIFKIADELADEDHDVATEENFGVYTTLTHEIRHLGFANPFLPDDKYPDSENTEDAIERWGINTFEEWYYKKRKTQITDTVS